MKKDALRSMEKDGRSIVRESDGLSYLAFTNELIGALLRKERIRLIDHWLRSAVRLFSPSWALV